LRKLDIWKRTICHFWYTRQWAIQREREKKYYQKIHTKKASIPDSPKYIIAAHVDAMTAPGRLPGIVGQA